MGLKGMTIVIIKLNNTFILSTETSSHPVCYAFTFM